MLSMAKVASATTPAVWKFIFSDPTFGGECPAIEIVHRRPSMLSNSTPLVQDLPADVQEMLLGTDPSSKEDEAPMVAGSGAKAAEYLRRLSNDSGGSGLSGSGFSDSEDEKDKGKGKNADQNTGQGAAEDSDGSGFSDVSVKSDKSKSSKKSKSSEKSKSPKRYISNDSAGSGGDKAVSLAVGRAASDKLVEEAAPAAPVRANRRADTTFEKKRPSLSGSDDDDLLSNPFASDSEEDPERKQVDDKSEPVKPKDSARSKGSKGSKDSKTS